VIARFGSKLRVSWMSDDLIAMPERIAEFLRMALPDGPYVLGAIRVEGGAPKVRTFEDANEAAAWAASMNAGRAHNLYWIHNRLRGRVDEMPKDADVLEVVFLHIDCDPPKKLPREKMTAEELTEWNAAERKRLFDRLVAFDPEPTFIVDSGGGCQAFMRLDVPLYIDGDGNRIEDAKAYTRQLRDVLDGDNCHSLAHLMRLPYAVNWPDGEKRKRGRVPRLATLIHQNGKAYPLHDFTPAPAQTAARKRKKSAAAAERGELRRLANPAELEQWGVSPRMQAVIAYGTDPEDPTCYASRSEAVFGVCTGLVRCGVPAELIVGIITDESWAISAHVLAQKGSTRYAWAQVEAALEDVGTVRPRIIYDESELPRVLDEAEAALLASGVSLYQMNGRLVQPVRLDAGSADEHGVRRAAGALVIHGVKDHRLLEHMIAAARFVKVVKDKNGKPVEKPVAPHLKFATHYAERVGAWRLPALDGISTIPTMRGDGTIVSAEGYDPASRLLIDKQGVDFPAVPDRPTHADALAAVEALLEPLSEFPFVQDRDEDEPCGDHPSASRSAALAMMLTAVIRKSLGSAPIFGLSAPTMETGKSLLADIPAWLVTGREAAMMSQGASEEEDQKGLLSILMSGDPVNVIDNISREVSGDALCTILTKETWQQRWLGANRMVTVSTKALFIANGNNLVFREDMATRAIMVSLDAQMERPGERVFQRDLKTWVPEHRGEVVAAALTVLRAYVVAGRPRPADMKPTRFADWDIVRGALLWLGEPDPWVTQARVTAGDSARGDLVGLMMALRDAFGAGQFVSPREIIARADQEAQSQMDHSLGPLGLALSAASAGRGGVNPVALGKYLKRKADRRHEGMWIKAREDAKKGNRYAVMVEGPKPAQQAML
jgi:hypothetical protein